MATESNTGIEQTPTGERFISKSKFLSGLQCPKLLWHVVHASHLLPAPDDAQQAIFDQSHEVGALAKRLFPGGIQIGSGNSDLDGPLQLTQQALRHRQPLFEAAFSAEGGYCRVDVLRPASDDSWDLIEVKSTTSIKEVHLEDLAFQTWVLAMAGLKLRRCYLMHINPAFVRQGEIDPQQLFVLQDVTNQAANLGQLVPDKLDDMFKTIRQHQAPEIKIGHHCGNPNACPLQDQCWSFLPEHSVLDLYRGAKKGFNLLDQGIRLLKDIPEDCKLTANQTIQKDVAISGQPHVNQDAIARFLKRLRYPLHFLDFETFSTAIPLFDGAKPYQQVPFQFSLHIVREPGGKPEHRMFLAEGRDDPRAEFMRELRLALEDTGSVIAYNAGFEMARLKEGAAFLPEYAGWLQALEKRVVDLLLPFRNFAYYHPAQAGSASMKAVLPALTGKSYQGLAIQEGGTASREFLRVTFGDVEESERKKVRGQLETYCGQDTEGMVWIMEVLNRAG